MPTAPTAVADVHQALARAGGRLLRRRDLPHALRADARVFAVGRSAGPGPGQEVLQTGKREVGIVALEPVGNYAVQPTFSDGHDTGIFSWDYLYFLGSQQATLWQRYEQRLAGRGVDRDAPMAAAGGGRAVRPPPLSTVAA